MNTAVEPVLSPSPESAPTNQAEPSNQAAPNRTAPGEAAGGRAFWDQFGRVVTLTVLAATLAALILAAPALAITWQRQPFLGAFLEQTLILNDTGASGPQPWPAFAAGALPGDQLLAVDGVPVRTSREVSYILSGKAAGQPVQLTLGRPGAVEPVTISVSLSQFPSSAFVTYFGMPYFVAVVYIAIGLLVFWLRRGEAAGRAFALFCATAAIGLGGVFDLYTTHWFTWAWTLAVPAAGGALMTLGQLFPQENRMAQRQPGSRLLPFIPALLLAAYALYTLYGGGDPRAYILA
ncbi:MAG: PDZ domain-containing protein, partial [Anaerolineales bacterium]